MRKIFVWICVFCLCIYSALLWKIWRYSKQLTTNSDFDAVLVLGARAYINGKPNPCLVARVNKGVTLVADVKDKSIIFSGGTDIEDGRNEAKIMQEISHLSGPHVLLEQNSTSTYENLLFSRDLAKKYTLDRLVVVSEPFHLYRTMLVANKLGIQATPVATDVNSCWPKIFKEPIAIIGYWLRGQI